MFDICKYNHIKKVIINDTTRKVNFLLNCTIILMIITLYARYIFILEETNIMKIILLFRLTILPSQCVKEKYEI